MFSSEVQILLIPAASNKCYASHTNTGLLNDCQGF